jgi:APA family basic amino acid/polyamine antiporter
MHGAVAGTRQLAIQAVVDSRSLTAPRAHPAFDRSIGLLPATAMVAGIMIGASIFVQPSEISRHVPSVPGMLLVWLLAGLLTLCGSLVCAELSSAFPRTGGVFVFLRETLSPGFGFLWGWAMFWSVHSGIIAATSVIFARYAAYFIPLGDLGIRVGAIAAILLLSGINCLGVRQGSSLQTIVTIAKIAAIAVILVLVFAVGEPAAQPPSAPSRVSFGGLVLGISAGLFAFGGWHMVAYAAGETRNPERTIPKALLIGTLTVTTCYLALNAAFLYLLPLDRVISSTRVAADAADALAGSRGATAVSGLVILSSLGVLNGVILAGPRMYFAMAQDGLAFRWMGAMHPRRRTPYAAILAQALWSSVLVATGTYRGLFTRVIYTEWLFFALMTVGLFRLRRRAGYAPVYRAWGYPVVPLLFLVACVIVALFQIAADPLQASSGLFLVALGLPVYHLWMRHADH